MSLSSGIHGSFHKVGNTDPRNLHRILETQEQPGPRPLFRLHGEQILSVISDRTFSNLISRPPGKNRAESTFSGTVRSHDGMYFTSSYGKVQPFEDLLPLYICMEVIYLKQYIIHIILLS